MDSLEVMVELANRELVDNFRALESLEENIRHKLRTVLQIDAKVRLVEPKTLERFTGKAKRVIDLRKQE